MADKKMTKRDWFTLIAAAIDTHPEVPESAKEGMKGFIAHEVELLSRKRTNATGDAKKKAEQTAVKRAIATALAENVEPMRATAIAAVVGESVQKVTALLRQMVEDAEVVREVEKKVTTFHLP